MKDTASTQQPALRKDAARNRRRIMDAARDLATDGKPVQLNAVAQAADVGSVPSIATFRPPKH